jgi:hypothetical protein
MSDHYATVTYHDFLISEAAWHWKRHRQEPDRRIPLGEFRHHASKAIAALGLEGFASAFRVRAGKLGLDAPTIDAALSGLAQGASNGN